MLQQQNQKEKLTVFGQVLDVTGQQTQRGSTRYVVTVQNDQTGQGQELSTMKYDIAAKAQQVVGKGQVKIGVTHEKKPKNDGNGFWDNYYLDDVEQVGPQQAQQGQTPPVVQNGVSGNVQVSIPQGLSASDKDERIVRGNAVNATAQLFTAQGLDLEDFLTYADQVASYIRDGKKVPQTPQEVAEQVPGVQVGVQADPPPDPSSLVDWGSSSS